MRPTIRQNAMTARLLAERLPLIRLLSRPLTGFLEPLGVTPNQITLIGIVAGVTAAFCYLRGGTAWSLAGAVLFFLYYLLDNCDGELARLKGLQSRLGARLDDLGDWLVHTALFLALGVQMTQSTGQAVWMWLAGAAAIGATINAGLMLAEGAAGEADVSRLSELPENATWIDVAGFVLRGLIKADFWLILLLLTLSDVVWILLPTAAVGSQVFWLLYLRKTVRRFHT